MAKKVKTCPCNLDTLTLAAVPVETTVRAYEAGMTFDDYIKSINAAHQTCCAKGYVPKGAFNLAGLLALIQELEAIIAAFIPGA